MCDWLRVLRGVGFKMDGCVDQVGDIPEDLCINAAWLVCVYAFFGRVLALSFSLGFYKLQGNNQWTQLQNDAAFRALRMAHWRTTVEQTNLCLAERSMDVRVDLDGHFLCQLSSLTLSGCDFDDRLGLALRGHAQPSEPNMLRWHREAVRRAIAPPWRGVSTHTAEARQ